MRTVYCYNFTQALHAELIRAYTYMYTFIYKGSRFRFLMAYIQELIVFVTGYDLASTHATPMNWKGLNVQHNA